MLFKNELFKSINLYICVFEGSRLHASFVLVFSFISTFWHESSWRIFYFFISPFMKSKSQEIKI